MSARIAGKTERREKMAMNPTVPTAAQVSYATMLARQAAYPDLDTAVLNFRRDFSLPDGPMSKARYIELIDWLKSRRGRPDKATYYMFALECGHDARLCGPGPLPEVQETVYCSACWKDVPLASRADAGRPVRYEDDGYGSRLEPVT
jgi:hypothetical protein